MTLPDALETAPQTPPATRSWWTDLAGAALLILLVALPAGWRLVGETIWYDEALTHLVTSGNPWPDWPDQPIPAGEVKAIFRGPAGPAETAGHILRTDVHPPHYFLWISSACRPIFGDSLEAIRSFSLVVISLAVVALWVLLRVAEARFALLPAAVFALSTTAVNFGHDARMYALAVLMVTLVALLVWLADPFRSGDELPSDRRLLLLCPAAGAAAGVAVLTHYFALFSVGFMILWLAVTTWRRSRRAVLAAVITMAIVGSLATPFLAYHLNARAGQFVGFPGVVVALRGFWRDVVYNLADVALLPHEKGRLLITASVALFLTAGAGTLFMKTRAMPRRLVAFCVGWILCTMVGLLLMGMVFNKDLLQLRYVVFVAPAAAIVATAGILELVARHRLLGAGALLLLLGAEVIANLAWVNPEPDYRWLARQVIAGAEARSLVVAGPGWGRGAPAATLYELPDDVDFLVVDDLPALQALGEATRAYDRIWFVGAPERQSSTEQAALALLRASAAFAPAPTGATGLLRPNLHRFDRRDGPETDRIGPRVETEAGS